MAGSLCNMNSILVIFSHQSVLLEIVIFLCSVFQNWKTAENGFC